MAQTDIDIANKALVLLGAEKISSFTEGTTEANIAAELYETTVRTALTSARWRFNTKQADLGAAIADGSASAPKDRWERAWTMPTDVLLLHTVTENDVPIRYTIMGQRIMANASEDATLIAEYQCRTIEDEWPPQFTSYAVELLAATFAQPITGDTELMDYFKKQSRFTLGVARALLGQQQTGRRLRTQGGFLAFRRS